MNEDAAGVAPLIGNTCNIDTDAAVTKTVPTSPAGLGTASVLSLYAWQSYSNSHIDSVRQWHR